LRNFEEILQTCSSEQADLQFFQFFSDFFLEKIRTRAQEK